MEIKKTYRLKFYEIINELLEYLYPDNITCIICDNPIPKQNTYSLCKDCFNKLDFIIDGCVKCGKKYFNHSLEENLICCTNCKNKKFYFNRAISCISYSELSKKLVFRLKYNNHTYISKYIAKIMKEKLKIENIKYDYILCVPLHKNRLKKRGFNQAQKIAKYLSELVEKPFLDVIKRDIKTKKLYNLGKSKREEELKNAFSVDYDFKNKNVLLIDDIFTTGATVNEISKQLRFNNVSKIYVLTLLSKV